MFTAIFFLVTLKDQWGAARRVLVNLFRLHKKKRHAGRSRPSPVMGCLGRLLFDRVLNVWSSRFYEYDKAFGHGSSGRRRSTRRVGRGFVLACRPGGAYFISPV